MRSSILAAACIVALAGMPANADAVTRGGRPFAATPVSDISLATDETGCTEIAYPRGGLADKVRRLVPDRFELVPFPTPDGAPARVSLFVSEITCRTVTTETARHRDKQRDVASIMVTAETATVDGQPSGGPYVLFYATENRLEQRYLNKLGWQTDLLRGSSGIEAVTTPGGLTQAVGAFAGSGWDHVLTFATVYPAGQPETGGGAYYRDTATQKLKRCYNTDVVPVFGMISSDLTTTPLATVTAVPPVFAGYSGNARNGTFLYRGSWQSTLTDQSCP